MSIMLINYQNFVNNLESVQQYNQKVTYKPSDYIELIKIFQNLYIANTKSYNVRYKEHETININELQFDKTPVTYKHNSYSLLKSLQCLRYNIEIDENIKLTVEEKQAVDWLDSFIEKLMFYIISTNELYKTAKWW